MSFDSSPVVCPHGSVLYDDGGGKYSHDYSSIIIIIIIVTIYIIVTATVITPLISYVGITMQSDNKACASNEFQSDDDRWACG